jgi:hypothetical protein
MPELFGTFDKAQGEGVIEVMILNPVRGEALEP